MHTLVADSEHGTHLMVAACHCLNLLLYHCVPPGSSTACVLVVNGTTLSASNLGDSGFVLVRDGVATFQCPQQQHNFNFPFQLGSADSMSDQPQAAMVSRGCVGGGEGAEGAAGQGACLVREGSGVITDILPVQWPCCCSCLRLVSSGSPGALPTCCLPAVCRLTHGSCLLPCACLHTECHPVCCCCLLQRFELQLEPGDIIVTGSDGLWDNIFAEEAATIASKCKDKGETATTAAQVLCR